MNTAIMLKGLADTGRAYVEGKQQAPILAAERDLATSERNFKTSQLAEAASSLKKKPVIELAQRFSDPNYYLTTSPDQQKTDFDAYNAQAPSAGLPIIDPVMAKNNVIGDAMWKEATTMYSAGIPEDVATQRLVDRYGQEYYDRFAHTVHSKAAATQAQNPVRGGSPTAPATAQTPLQIAAVAPAGSPVIDPTGQKQWDPLGAQVAPAAAGPQAFMPEPWAQPSTAMLKQAAPALVDQTPTVTAGALKAALPGAEPDNAATTDTSLLHSLYGASRLTKQEQDDAKTMAAAVKAGQYHTAAKTDAYGRTPGELIARDWNAMHPGKPVPSYLLTVGPSATTANALTSRDDKLSAEDRKRRDHLADAVRMGRATIEDFSKAFPDSDVPQMSPYAKAAFERGRQANWALHERINMAAKKERFTESMANSRLTLAKEAANRAVTHANTQGEQFKLRLIAAGISGLKAAGGKWVISDTPPYQGKFVQSESDKEAVTHWETVLKGLDAMDEDGNILVDPEGTGLDLGGGQPSTPTGGGGTTTKTSVTIDPKREIANVAATIPDSDPNKRKINGILNGWGKLSPGDQKQVLQIVRNLRSQ